MAGEPRVVPTREGYDRDYGLDNDYHVDEEFMVMELTANALHGVRGRVKYQPEFEEVER